MIPGTPTISENDLLPFVRLALACIHRPYPHHLVHVVNADTDVLVPRQLYPAFCGCFDWHSAVHSHWALVRAMRLFPAATWNPEVRAALARNLTEANLATEAAYFRAPGHEGFERPYGLAWLLQLAAELREFDDRGARQWLEWISPLESITVERLRGWLPKLSHPIRGGEHSQTAFAMRLALDWARVAQNKDFERLLISRAMEFHAADRDAPLAYEPSGHDFLSPVLAEADLMRRVMPPDEFDGWLSAFLPQIPADGSFGWLLPAGSSDPADGKLSHLNGLNLSRAWMLEGIADGLSSTDRKRPALYAAAQMHAQAGLAAISPERYAGAHWLGSFAVYLLTQRGMR